MSVAFCPICQMTVTVVGEKCLADHQIDPDTISAPKTRRRVGRKAEHRTGVLNLETPTTLVGSATISHGDTFTPANGHSDYTTVSPSSDWDWLFAEDYELPSPPTELVQSPPNHETESPVVDTRMYLPGELSDLLEADSDSLEADSDSGLDTQGDNQNDLPVDSETMVRDGYTKTTVVDPESVATNDTLVTTASNSVPPVDEIVSRDEAVSAGDTTADFPNREDIPEATFTLTEPEESIGSEDLAAAESTEPTSDPNFLEITDDYSWLYEDHISPNGSPATADSPGSPVSPNGPTTSILTSAATDSRQHEIQQPVLGDVKSASTQEIDLEELEAAGLDQNTSGRVARMWNDPNELPITEWAPSEAPIATQRAAGRIVRRLLIVLALIAAAVFGVRYGLERITDSTQQANTEALAAAAVLSDTTTELSASSAQLVSLASDPTQRITLSTQLARVDGTARNLFELAADLSSEDQAGQQIRSEGAELARRAFRSEAELSSALAFFGVALPLTFPPELTETASSEQIAQITVSVSRWVSDFMDETESLPDTVGFEEVVSAAQLFSIQLPDVQQRYLNALRDGDTQQTEEILMAITSGLVGIRAELDQAMEAIGQSQGQELEEISVASRTLSQTSF